MKEKDMICSKSGIWRGGLAWGCEGFEGKGRWGEDCY